MLFFISAEMRQLYSFEGRYPHAVEFTSQPWAHRYLRCRVKERPFVASLFAKIILR